MTTDVLFTHSYFLRFDPKEYRAMMPYPPLGTLYAAAVAREAGYGVALFDAMLAESEREIEEQIRRHRPRFVVVYDDDFNYLTKMCLTRMREAACVMTRIAKEHGCTTIVHSSDATDHLLTYFEHGVDFILVGEAERTLQELLDTLTGRSSLPPWQIPGVACLGEGGVIERGPKREPARDLDALPLPARDLIDVDRYRRVWTERHGYFSMNIATTRGCPFHCNWCAKPIYGQVYNSHSPERIAREMRLLKQEYRVDHIWFCDDIFGLKPGWVQAFGEEVKRLDAAVPFKCLSRSDLIVRDNAVHALRAAGCSTVWIGAESGSQRILDAMDKGTTVEQIHEATRLMREVGIRVGFFLQFGYPGEGDREIEQTIEMVRSALPDEIGISVSYPLPGTKFHERVRAELGAKQNWAESADLAMMFRGTYATEFYRVLARWVHMDHRRHLAKRALRESVGTGRLPAREQARRIVLTPYYAANGLAQKLRLERLRRPLERPTVLLPVIES